MKKIEILFEGFLWKSRFIVLLAVVASLISSVLLFVIATIDVGRLVINVIRFSIASHEQDGNDQFHGDVVSHIITAVDDYLLATVLLIFALGLYELFISKIDQAEQDSRHSSQILLIKTLDDLKDRLAKVVLMILIVTFFKNVLHIPFHEPLSILYLGAGILLVALALYFTHGAGHAKGS
ncbi:MAG TPA: YqhA family protein [Candidatus Manganitrophaceae bacterium]|nr:YqhA family protein [Candidatus Manganitrophaceae bacterium]